MSDIEEPQEPTKNISLQKVVESFGTGINEEQAWAIIHQTVSFLKESRGENTVGVERWKNSIGSPLLHSILLDQDGSVAVVSEEMEGNLSVGDDADKWIDVLARSVVEACHFGLEEEQEADLSQPLTDLINLMITDENNPDGPNKDDGIEAGETSEDEDESLSDRHKNPFDHTKPEIVERIFKRTVCRCGNLDEANKHYRAVCHALVIECLDLVEFLRKVRNPESDSCFMETGGSEFHEWAKLWMQVVGQLRKGLQLRKVQPVNGDEPLVYEMTPYEMLMEDIKTKRFSLKNTPSNSDRQLDRLHSPHDIILDYIRSRPPLLPAENRILAPPKDSRGPRDFLLDSIRRFEASKLHKAVPPTTPKLTGPSSACPENLVGDSIMIPKKPSDDVIPRRKILPDEELSEPIDFQQDDGKGSVGQCDSRMSDFDDESERSKRTCADVISLRLDEIALIRGALAKAELENLEDQDMNLCTQIRRAEVCYSCKKTRFRWYLGKPGVKCHLCQNMVCTSCSKKMNLPCDRLECIPVYTLSPSSDPEDEEERIQPDYQFPTNTKRVTSSASTLPRQRIQRSQSHDMTSYSMTLPKAQPKKRAPLQRGLTLVPFRNSPTLSPEPTPSPTLLTNRKSFAPNPRANSKDVVIEVCLVCHNVLLHAIIESQSQLQSIYNESGNVFMATTQNGKKNAPFRSSNSSVISESTSESLDEDYEPEVEREQVRSKGLRNISPDVTFSRSDSNAELGSYFTSHI